MSVRPEGRFEWERILRRVILPQPEKRKTAAAAPTVKHVGLAAATYGDMDGTRIRPGTTRLAAVTGYSESTVERALRQLVEMGFLIRVVSGSRQGRRAWSSEFRLSVPEDLLDRFEMLPVAELPAPAPGAEPVDNSVLTGDLPAPAPGDPVDFSTDQTAPAQGETVDQMAPAPGSDGASADPQDHYQPHNQQEHLRLSTTVTPPTRLDPVDNRRHLKAV